jgi:hypothetical protein
MQSDGGVVILNDEFYGTSQTADHSKVDNQNSF